MVDITIVSMGLIMVIYHEIIPLKKLLVEPSLIGFLSAYTSDPPSKEVTIIPATRNPSIPYVKRTSKMFFSLSNFT
jgi:hypothetical protein